MYRKGRASSVLLLAVRALEPGCLLLSTPSTFRHDLERLFTKPIASLVVL